MSKLMKFLKYDDLFQRYSFLAIIILEEIWTVAEKLQSSTTTKLKNVVELCQNPAHMLN